LTGFVNNADGPLNITEIRGKLYDPANQQQISDLSRRFSNVPITIDSANEITLEVPWTYSKKLSSGLTTSVLLTAFVHYEDEDRTYESLLGNFTFEVYPKAEPFDALLYAPTLVSFVFFVFILCLLPVASPGYAALFAKVWRQGSQASIHPDAQQHAGASPPIPVPEVALRDPIWLSQYKLKFPSLKKVLTQFLSALKVDGAEAKSERLAKWNMGVVDHECTVGDGRVFALLAALLPEHKKDLVHRLENAKYPREVVKGLDTQPYPQSGEKSIQCIKEELNL